jgi:hypothetical protein
MIMKKILILSSLLISCSSFSQSRLPPCNGDFSGPCFGTQTYPYDEKYVGQWKDGNLNGYGTMYDSNGTILHQGLWKNDKFIQA